MRRLFILFLLPLCLYGQQHRIRHSLRFDPAGGSLSGQTQIRFPAGQYQDSLFLHLPPRALSNRQSYLHQQVASFQRVDLYYASADELGYLEMKRAQINEKDISLKTEAEFVAIPLPRQTGDSLEITLQYRLKLPTEGIFASQHSDAINQIFDWLPRIPARKNGRWLLYPVNYHADDFQPYDHFELNFKLPASWQVLSNLKKSQALSSGDSVLWKLSGNSRQLHLHWSSLLQKVNLPGGKELWTLGPALEEQAMVTASLQRIENYYRFEWGTADPTFSKIILLPEHPYEYQSKELIYLENSDELFDLQNQLAKAWAESRLRYSLGIDGFTRPWLARGLAHYYQFEFIRENWPAEQWVPYGDSWIGKIFDLDEFSYSYQNYFLYLFLVRQGLDQQINTSADSLSRLNYEAISQGKTALAFRHLRAYLGDKDFRRAMQDWLSFDKADESDPLVTLKAKMNYYSPKPLDWFFDDLLNSADFADYRLLEHDYCSTVSTVKVKNRGHLPLPYSITGYKNGEPVLTEWFEGHLGTKTQQVYHEEYDRIVINDHGANPEFSLKNNRWYDRWLFPRAEPLDLTFYNSFEKPAKSQLFYFPSLRYNAYDKVLAGMIFSNASFLVQKPLEYTLNPTFSTGTGQLTGSASLVWNKVMPKSHFFRQISSGAFFRYFHYDRDLAFLRFSPAVNFYLRKPYPTSPLIRRLRIRGVRVDREQPPELNLDQQRFLASYSVGELRYTQENTDVFRPSIQRVSFELSDRFAKVSGEWDQRWMLPNRKWLILRAYGGYFISNQFADRGFENNFYDFSLNNTPDYLFDEYFIGRSDETGIWSRQFFASEGGFKSPGDIRASEWMATLNLALPLYSVLGTFGDVGWADGQFVWDYGIRVALLTDFLEFYFPIQNDRQNFLLQQNYLSNVRFVLDLDLGNIVDRLRWGYY